MGICHQKSKWFGALRHNYWLLHDSVLSVLIIGNVYCVPINSKYLLNVHKYYISKYFDDGSSADTLWFNPKKKSNRIKIILGLHIQQFTIVSNLLRFWHLKCHTTIKRAFETFQIHTLMHDFDFITNGEKNLI